MSLEDSVKEPLSPQYEFWTPGEGRALKVGPEQRPVPLESIPLPLHKDDLEEGEPSDDAVGRGIYDYLRQFPDCPLGKEYARLLREAFPHYLADIGAQAAMLDSREVDAPYILRKTTCLKILALLEPDNPGLLQQIGISLYEHAVMFSELQRCRKDLLEAMGYLRRSLQGWPENPASLNYLGQIDFLLGDYPGADRHWKGVVAGIPTGPAREALSEKLGRIARGEVPDHPLVDDLEAVGEAMAAAGRREYSEAVAILEALEEEGTLPKEMPMPEFYYLLGVCRARGGDAGGAFESFERALELDPEFAPALEGKDAVLEGRAI